MSELEKGCEAIRKIAEELTLEDAARRIADLQLELRVAKDGHREAQKGYNIACDNFANQCDINKKLRARVAELEGALRKIAKTRSECNQSWESGIAIAALANEQEQEQEGCILRKSDPCDHGQSERVCCTICPEQDNGACECLNGVLAMLCEKCGKPIKEET